MAAAQASVQWQGKRILIVEDEFLLAGELAANFRREGCLVLGPAPALDRALALLGGDTPDAAVVDVNLNGERSTALIEVLLRRNVPFVVVSGYNIAQLTEPAFRGVPHLDKPFRWPDLLGALALAMARAAARRGGAPLNRRDVVAAASAEGCATRPR